MADFIPKQLEELLFLHREVNEKDKQLDDVKNQLSQCTDAAQQAALQSKLNQLQSTVDDLIVMRKLLTSLSSGASRCDTMRRAPLLLVHRCFLRGSQGVNHCFGRPIELPEAMVSLPVPVPAPG